ncbi:MAG: CDP-alcohol phosphatidyltransferase family protein [Epsilonproteobacteria bacterium]|nr:CDP-alcohol phosphatidyltransferase family protein [Campylobacterota bacterium]
MVWTLPNLLSLFRILAAPFLVLVAWLGFEELFLILFLLMLLSDALDGWVARIFNLSSALGARLDSYGDIVTYLTMPIGAWLLWPTLIQKEISYIIIAVIIYLLPGGVALIKFGSLASYHTWFTKFSALCMSLSLLVLLFSKDATLFHIAVYILVIEAVENIAITLMLPTQQSDIHSLWHAWKQRK